jgi:autotransporter-associated beta strand protein
MLALVLVGCGTARADGLLWQGTVNGQWDLATANWTDGFSAAVFASGADARFDDTAAAKTVTLSGDVQAGAVVFDNGADYTLAGAKLAAATHFVKRGAGELKITGNGHTFAGDLLVEAGTLTVTADNDFKNVASGPLGNPRVPRTVTVLTNGTLNIVGKNPFGAGTSTAPLADLRVIGGTLNLTTNFANAFGSVWLDNATVNYNGGLSGSPGRFWGTATFGSNLTFKGDSPYVFASRGNNCAFVMGKDGETDVWVDDITGDAAADVAFDLDIRYTPHADPVSNRDGADGRFRKTGPGTLSLNSRFNDFTGDVSVVAGVLAAGVNGYGLNAVTGPLGNPQIPRRIFAGTNAVLRMAGNDVLGQVWSSPKTEIVVAGGTLEQTAGKVNCFGPLTLENATLTYSGRNGDWGTLVFHGDVAFRGTNAYDLANVSDSRLRCGRNRMTFFDVADIPGADVDVTVGMRIDDCIAGSVGGVPFPAMPSNLGKKGPGTLSLSNHGNTFTGDVEVAEGVLLIPSGGNGENKVTSCLGNPQIATRQLLVHSGAELSLKAGNTLGQLASSVKMATVISNATLRLSGGTCNGFGPLTLHDATLIYSTGEGVWGVLGLGGHTVIGGTRPLAFPVAGSTCRFNLGYSLGLDIQELPGVTNYVGQTEITVHDITGSAATDATFEVPLQNIPTWVNGPLFKTVTFKCGLLKSGEGTLSIASTDNSYTGPTTVTQGVLRVDGSLTSSAVTVAAGAALGGTGSVAHVTMAEGARFDVSADQTVPLTIGSLALAGGGTVAVHNPDGIDRTEVNVPLFRVTGSLNGFDPSAWTVLLDGAEPSAKLRLRQNADGTVYARWAPLGTLIRMQ